MRREILVPALAAAFLAFGCGNKQETPPAQSPAPAEAPGAEATPEADAPTPEAPVAPVNDVTFDVALPEGAPSRTTNEKDQRKRDNLLSAQAPRGTENVVAWSGEKRIFVDDFDHYIKRMPPAQRREFSSLEKKQEMVRNMITFYTLAQEAQARGLDKDPEVLLAMRTEMVKKLLQERFGEGAPVAVDDAMVEARYQEHFTMYNKPARVRASHILLADKAEAEKVYAELKREIEVPGNSTRKVFREFVRKYSTDTATVERGGDLLFFAADGRRDGAPNLDPTLAQAAFVVQNVNQVSRVIKSELGYHILLITNRREEVARPLAEVKESIRENLAREQREKLRREFMDKLVDFDQWHIDSQILDAIGVESAPSQPSLKARMDSIKKEVNPNAPPKAEPK